MLLRLQLKDVPTISQITTQCFVKSLVYLAYLATVLFAKKGASFNVHNISGVMSGTLVMGSRYRYFLARSPFVKKDLT